MALNSAEIESIRRYLGYAADAGTLSAIAAQCSISVSEPAEATVRSILRQLDRLQQQMTTAVPFSAQTFNSGAGGTQQYAPGERMGSLHREANQYIAELAATTNLIIKRRIYGTSLGGGRTMRG